MGIYTDFNIFGESDSLYQNKNQVKKSKKVQDIVPKKAENTTQNNTKQENKDSNSQKVIKDGSKSIKNENEVEKQQKQMNKIPTKRKSGELLSKENIKRQKVDDLPKRSDEKTKLQKIGQKSLNLETKSDKFEENKQKSKNFQDKDKQTKKITEKVIKDVKEPVSTKFEPKTTKSKEYKTNIVKKVENVTENIQMEAKDPGTKPKDIQKDENNNEEFFHSKNDSKQENPLNITQNIKPHQKRSFNLQKVNEKQQIFSRNDVKPSVIQRLHKNQKNEAKNEEKSCEFQQKDFKNQEKKIKERSNLKNAVEKQQMLAKNIVQSSEALQELAKSSSCDKQQILSKNHLKSSKSGEIYKRQEILTKNLIRAPENNEIKQNVPENQAKTNKDYSNIRTIEEKQQISAIKNVETLETKNSWVKQQILSQAHQKSSKDGKICENQLNSNQSQIKTIEASKFNHNNLAKVNKDCSNLKNNVEKPKISSEIGIKSSEVLKFCDKQKTSIQNLKPLAKTEENNSKTNEIHQKIPEIHKMKPKTEESIVKNDKQDIFWKLGIDEAKFRLNLSEDEEEYENKPKVTANPEDSVQKIEENSSSDKKINEFENVFGNSEAESQKCDNSDQKTDFCPMKDENGNYLQENNEIMCKNLGKSFENGENPSIGQKSAIILENKNKIQEKNTEIPSIKQKSAVILENKDQIQAENTKNSSFLSKTANTSKIIPKISSETFKNANNSSNGQETSSIQGNCKNQQRKSDTFIKNLPNKEMNPAKVDKRHSLGGKMKMLQQNIQYSREFAVIPQGRHRSNSWGTYQNAAAPKSIRQDQNSFKNKASNHLLKEVIRKIENNKREPKNFKTSVKRCNQSKLPTGIHPRTLSNIQYDKLISTIAAFYCVPDIIQPIEDFKNVQNVLNTSWCIVDNSFLLPTPERGHTRRPSLKMRFRKISQNSSHDEGDGENRLIDNKLRRMIDNYAAKIENIVNSMDREKVA